MFSAPRVGSPHAVTEEEILMIAYKRRPWLPFRASKNPLPSEGFERRRLFGLCGSNWGIDDRKAGDETWYEYLYSDEIRRDERIELRVKWRLM